MHAPQDIDDAREYDARMQRNRNPITSEVILLHSARRERNMHIVCRRVTNIFVLCTYPFGWLGSVQSDWLLFDWFRDAWNRINQSDPIFQASRNQSNRSQSDCTLPNQPNG